MTPEQLTRALVDAATNGMTTQQLIDNTKSYLDQRPTLAQLSAALQRS